MNQLELTISEGKRDIGIERAGSKADRDHGEWTKLAVEWITAYAKRHERFLAEHARGAAELGGFVVPQNRRAWGAAIKRAEREHVIEFDGYAPANSSNRSPKVLWKSRVFDV